MQLYKREAEESIQNKFVKEIRHSRCSLREICKNASNSALLAAQTYSSSDFSITFKRLSTVKKKLLPFTFVWHHTSS